MDALEYSECRKKERYRTYERADKYRSRQMRSGGPRLFVYLCRHCIGWHLTSRQTPYE